MLPFDRQLRQQLGPRMGAQLAPLGMCGAALSTAYPRAALGQQGLSQLRTSALENPCIIR